MTGTPGYASPEVARQIDEQRAFTRGIPLMKNILEAIEGGHPSDEAVFKTVFDHTDDLSAEALTHMPEALERGRRTYNEMRRAGPEREG